MASKRAQNLSFDAEGVAAALGSFARVLLVTDSQMPKTAIAEQLARASRSDPYVWVSADPGSPLLGPPGAVNRGRWEDAWITDAVIPLCTLDAARFRLPLTRAVAALCVEKTSRQLVVGPGITAGVAGAELLDALVDAVAAEAIVLAANPARPCGLDAELEAAGLPVFRVSEKPAPRHAHKTMRRKIRTRGWDAFLGSAEPSCVPLEGLTLLGTPPPADVPEAWAGRQVAVGGASGGWQAFGEVESLIDGHLVLRAVSPCETGGAPFDADAAHRLLVRDAARDGNRQLTTARPVARPVTRGKHDARTPMTVRCGPLAMSLANGVTGDPLLILKLRHRRGAMLFDLGDCHDVSRRVLHTVTDVFLTHGHLDHIAGFPYLLRARLSAALPPLRIFGPPGTRGHVAGFLDGVCWDRIGDEGPAFEVHEIGAGGVEVFALQAGLDAPATPHRIDRIGSDGVVLRTPEVEIGTAQLDHGIPVLAYSARIVEQYNVDSEALEASGFAAGPWLADLKANVRNGDLDALLQLPNGALRTTAQLAETLVFATSGPRVVYATDFSDVPENREALCRFAAGADVLFCESTFRVGDVDHAERTQHVTTLACAEMACAAGVSRLVPFHFSKRYEGRLEGVYDELRRAAGSVSVVEHPALRG